ncbi:Hypothetical Protein FCC1311_007092 [Hondaea fermentalgiana]|uniref:SAC3/GANP/THP3 conserved domain-containing protein n=1 Tax=Hondaea fermentalgiana TaxID=2315210 RepID=A0A2R5G8V7_9STRA|nr:Hypothetical Protein FCC1311_007092 [Hondaea fermentalgiana]|eukprot:GBG24491.1 Hypothetical Protein FCC1311_007092 [Hondaea fermentalgiana]
MCPASEREAREREGDLADFEVVGYNCEHGEAAAAAASRLAPRSPAAAWAAATAERETGRKTSRELCVKKYRRSAAGMELASRPELLRDEETLVRTNAHLVRHVLLPELAAAARKRGPAARDGRVLRVVEFVADRFRGVRQDAAVQGLLEAPAMRKVLAQQTLVLLGALLYHAQSPRPPPTAAAAAAGAAGAAAADPQAAASALGPAPAVAMARLSQALAPLLESFSHESFSVNENATSATKRGAQEGEEDLDGDAELGANVRALGLLLAASDPDLAMRLPTLCRPLLQEEEKGSDHVDGLKEDKETHLHDVVHRHPALRSALELVRAWRRGETRRAAVALSVLRKQSALLRLAARGVVVEVAARGLEAMNKSYTHREPMPLSRVAHALGGLLGGNDAEETAFVHHVSEVCGLEVCVPDQGPHAETKTACVVFKSATFDRHIAAAKAWQSGGWGVESDLQIIIDVLTPHGQQAK